ncbi:unnamed protein product [Laminaria digitata]
MAEPASDINYVTVLRDPVEHWLSYFYFYFQPEMKVEVDVYFRTPRSENRPLVNPLAAEFGIYDQHHLDEFILDYLPTFTLAMLTEEMDEGLVLLGRILGWDPIDLTYASLLETGDGMIRWDDKPVKKAPKPKDLDSHTLSELARVTHLDAQLYRAVKDHYNEVRELHSDGLEEAVREFRVLQSDVLSFLDEEPTDSPARGWYMPESDYYFYSADKASWWQEEYAPALPF